MDHKVRSFQDFEVYKRLYAAMLVVIKEILPALPADEKFDLVVQMRRCSKSVLALMAEGYARRIYRKDWQKYLVEAIGECNEMMVHLSCCKDLYSRFVNSEMADRLIRDYDIGGKQLYRLAESWKIREREKTGSAVS